MSTLKKSLCLVLALIFVLGLCTVGAGAAFADADKVQYSEAVDTMASLGILVGDDNDGDGKMDFRPGDPITRAGAAKLIAYMMLGAENAERLPAKQVFDDVASTHWAAKYIYFCQLKGIVNGYGDGTFLPEKNVSTQGIFKMLLASAGYGSQGEFVGDGWDLNVVLAAMDNNLFTGTKNYDFEADATREEAALYVYNTLMTLDQVKYSKLIEDYQATTAGTFAQSAWGMEKAVGVIVANKLSGNLAGTRVASLVNNALVETDYVYDTTLDQIGHEVTVWYRTANSVNTAYGITDKCTEVAGRTLTAANTAATVQKTFADYKADATPTFPAAAATATGSYVLNEAGKVVSYKAVPTYFIAKLVVDKTTGKGTVNIGTVGAPDMKPVVMAEGMKNNDIVTVKVVGSLYKAEACTVKQGEQIYKKATVAGVNNYNDSAVVATKATAQVNPTGATAMAGTTDLTVGSYYDLYLDSTGKCYAYKAYTAPATNLVYFVAGYAKTSTNEYGNLATSYFAQCVDANGAIINYSVASDMSTSAEGVYKVTTSATDATKSILTAATAGTDYVTETYAANAPRLIADSDTVFVYLKKATGAADYKLGNLKVDLTSKPLNASAITYTFASNTVGSGSTVETKTLKTVWFATPDTTTAPAANSYVYVKSATVASVALVNGAAHDFYTAYKDGEVLDLHYAHGTQAPTVGFNTYTVNAQGTYSLTATATTPVELAASSTVNFILNNKLYVGSAAYDLANVKIKNIVTGSKVTLESVADLVELIAAGEQKATIDFVGVPAATAGAAGTIGGGTIYVTAITDII